MIETHLSASLPLGLGRYLFGWNYDYWTDTDGRCETENETIFFQINICANWKWYHGIVHSICWMRMFANNLAMTFLSSSSSWSVLARDECIDAISKCQSEWRKCTKKSRSRQQQQQQSQQPQQLQQRKSIARSQSDQSWLTCSERQKFVSLVP